MKPPKHQEYQKRQHKANTNKIIGKITYNPKKHKQKDKKKLCAKLQEQKIPDIHPVSPPTTLKFGAFNINGLDLEVSWAVEELLEKRGFDVSSETLYLNDTNK